jgi:hypothetical protein
VFLRDEVRRYLLQEDAILDAQEVILANISALEEQQGALAGRVILTLVNIEEESALKNGSYYVRNTAGNTIESISPAVYLNLYFLFSATLPAAEDPNNLNYANALNRISKIIELFQAKKEFTLRNTPWFRVVEPLNRRLVNELRLHPELYTLTFEQINHLWGSLGGKQSPSVMYKVRLVRIQSLSAEETPVIETVENETRALQPT